MEQTQSPHPSFFIGGTQTPILDFNLSREELLMAPVIASAALYYTESIFLKMMHWTVSYK